MTEGSIRTALSHLRAQFRQIVRKDVAEIDNEIAHLLRALT